MMAEYAAHFGHTPSSEMDWPLLVLMLERTPRFQARAQLAVFDGAASAIGTIDEKGAAAASAAREELLRIAYPSADVEPMFVVNMWGPDG